MRGIFNTASMVSAYFGVCRYCGYAGDGWPDSGQRPARGHINQSALPV